MTGRRAAAAWYRALPVVAVCLVGGPTATPDAAWNGGNQNRDALATLTGRLTGVATSEPVNGVRVGLTSLERTLVYQTTTDADGRFAFKAIRAGQYYVVVVRDQYTFQVGRVALRAGDALERVFRKSVEIAGTVVDERGATVPRVTVCALARRGATDRPRYQPVMWAETDARGRFLLGPGADAWTGAYIAAVMPTGCDVRVADVTGRLAGYPPLYAPGTTSVDEAVEMVLNPREPATLAFRLQPGPVTRVEGRLAGYVNTTVVPGQVLIEPPEGPVSFVRTARISPDGRFSVPGLTAGSYRLIVAPRRGPDPLNWAIQPVTLVGEPVRRLVIPLQQTMAVAGEIDFAGHLALLYGTRVFLTVNATPVGGRPGLAALLPHVFASVLPDGKFGLTGLMPGEYQLGVSGAEPWGWHIKSAMYSGPPGAGARLAPLDLFDAPIAVERGQNVFGLVITMTYLTTSVTGRVENAEGRPVTDAAVIVYSADPRYWRPPWRRVRVATVDREGAFAVAGLPEGDYLAVAQTSAAPVPNAALLESLRSSAQAFSLPDGASKELRLQLPGGLRIFHSPPRSKHPTATGRNLYRGTQAVRPPTN